MNFEIVVNCILVYTKELKYFVCSLIRRNHFGTDYRSSSLSIMKKLAKSWSQEQLKDCLKIFFVTDQKLCGHFEYTCSGCEHLDEAATPAPDDLLVENLSKSCQFIFLLAIVSSK